MAGRDAGNMNRENKDEDHHGKERGGEHRVAVPGEAQCAGEEGEAHEGDPEEMEGYPTGNAGIEAV